MSTNEVKLELSTKAFHELYKAADGRGKKGEVYKADLVTLLRDHAKLYAAVKMSGRYELVEKP